MKPDPYGLIDPTTGQFANPEYQALIDQFIASPKTANWRLALTCIILMVGVGFSHWLGRLVGDSPPDSSSASETGCGPSDDSANKRVEGRSANL